jgi:hypothetical protein
MLAFGEREASRSHILSHIAAGDDDALMAGGSPKASKLRLQRVPMAVDQGGDGADDPDHRAQQDPEQHGVFDERRPVLILLEPERILLELVQKHHYVKHNSVLSHYRPIVLRNQF